MSESRFVCLKDFEKEAYEVLPRNAVDYYKSGADDELTLSLNRLALNDYRIRPRILRNVSQHNLGTSIFESKLSVPIGVSPTAMQRMAHPEGEIATARAVGELGGVFILSTLATTSIEDVAAGAPNTTKWFQLYIYKDRAITEELVRRAENAGFQALVLTVDAPLFGNRRADVRNKFKLPPHLSLANFKDLQKSKGITSAKSGSGLDEYVHSLFDRSVVWEDIKWLKRLTSLPIVLKGILTREDTEMALKHGVAAIFVSNHGARQLDGVPASIEALSEVVSAVKRVCPVFVDGGFYQGSDIFKAMALGADMVFVGRPALWGLSHNGQEGVKHVLTILRNELERTMLLTGCCSIKDIERSMVTHKSFYARL